MTEIVFRSAAMEADGRTLIGVAVPFSRPTWVSDGGPSYRESFHPNSFNKAMKDQGDRPWPLMMMHPSMPGARTSPIPLGGVHFERTPAALEFRARVSKTRDGDEALELVNDGIVRDVSVGYRGFQSRESKDGHGVYKERMQAAPFEMSLAITGTGQYPGAQVLAVRSTPVTLADYARRRAFLIPR